MVDPSIVMRRFATTKAPAAAAVVAATVVGVVCGAPAAAPAATLPTVSSGTVALDLVADSNVTTSTGNVVQTWGDASSNGNTFTRRDGSPTLVANDLHGHAAVRFAGGGGAFDDLIATAGNLATNLNGQSVTVFMVTRNAASVNGVLDSNPGANTSLRTAFSIVQIPADNGPALNAAAGGSISSFRFSLAPNPSAGNTPTRFYETFLNTGGTPTPTATAYGTSTSLGETWNVTGTSSPTDVGTINFGSAGNANSFGGDLAELLVYKGALTDTDRVAVDSALFNTYLTPEPTAAALLPLASGLLLWRRTRRARRRGACDTGR